MGLTLEVVMAIVAVVHLSSAGEPTLALPDVTLTHGLLDQCDPPVDAQQHRKTDAPLDGDQDQVEPAEHQEPEKAMLALNTGKLHVVAAALGTFLIVCHDK